MTNCALRSLQRSFGLDLETPRNQHGGTSKSRCDENVRKRRTFGGCGPYKERFNIVEINMGVLRNGDVTKIHGNGQLFGAAVLTKNASKSAKST
jgi:hypothetical protein